MGGPEGTGANDIGDAAGVLVGGVAGAEDGITREDAGAEPLGPVWPQPRTNPPARPRQTTTRIIGIPMA
jgi:hypothetical protein